MQLEALVEYSDTYLATDYFLDLYKSGILRGICLAGEAPTLDEIARKVDAAIRVFFVAYDLQPARV